MLKLDPDPTKTAVQTKGGRPAEIYVVKEGQEYPLIGAYQNDQGRWVGASWTKEGGFLGDDSVHNCNIINKPAPPEIVTLKAWVGWNEFGRLIVYKHDDWGLAHHDCQLVAPVEIQALKDGDKYLPVPKAEGVETAERWMVLDNKGYVTSWIDKVTPENIEAYKVTGVKKVTVDLVPGVFDL